jgi:hypothetical protein
VKLIYLNRTSVYQQLGSVQSLLPLHSTVASSRMVSNLSIDSSNCQAVSQVTLSCIATILDPSLSYHQSILYFLVKSNENYIFFFIRFSQLIIFIYYSNNNMYLQEKQTMMLFRFRDQMWTLCISNDFSLKSIYLLHKPIYAQTDVHFFGHPHFESLILCIPLNVFSVFIIQPRNVLVLRCTSI